MKAPRKTCIFQIARERREWQELWNYFDKVTEDDELPLSAADLSMWASVGRWRGGPEGGVHWVKLTAGGPYAAEQERTGEDLDGEPLSFVELMELKEARRLKPYLSRWTHKHRGRRPRRDGDAPS